MQVTALVLWVMTALGGFAMLGIWLKRGGMRQQGGERRIRPPQILSHFALAATGLVLWIVYVATDSDGLGWVAAGLLVVVAGLGFSMLAVWLQQRRAVPAGRSGAATSPPEQHFPVPVVIAHGLFAVGTLVTAFIAAAVS